MARERIGRYEVIYPLAHGGMAEVYVGRLPGMAGFEKFVAIKLIHAHLSKEKQFIKMFLDEARLAASIRHPNVAEIYEVGRDGDLYFMVGELVLGQDLHATMRQARKEDVAFPEALSAHIVSQVCLGLHEAHEHKDPDGDPLGLVHRDVTPRNILLSYGGFAKLADFGVAWAQNNLAHSEV
ncbi:MAG TPA: serine/threonine-protein kinase, partial [Polyangia bacterium]|nr:serine/threonine-protein kinase [Polyangia bacterium]